MDRETHATFIFPCVQYILSQERTKVNLERFSSITRRIHWQELFSNLLTFAFSPTFWQRRTANYIFPPYLVCSAHPSIMQYNYLITTSIYGLSPSASPLSTRTHHLHNSAATKQVLLLSRWAKRSLNKPPCRPYLQPSCPSLSPVSLPCSPRPTFLISSTIQYLSSLLVKHMPFYQAAPRDSTPSSTLLFAYRYSVGNDKDTS